MANMPKFAWQLSVLDGEDSPSEAEVAWQGDNPCDGCGRFHYTEETGCAPTSELGPPPDHEQHCVCWYECEPCCRCGDHPVVLFGPLDIPRINRRLEAEAKLDIEDPQYWIRR